MIVDDRNKIILYHVRMLKIAKIGNFWYVPGGPYSQALFFTAIDEILRRGVGNLTSGTDYFGDLFY